MVFPRRQELPRTDSDQTIERLARRSLLVGLGRLFGAAAVLPLASVMTKPAEAESLEDKPGDMALGDPDAPIVMIEYFSLSCPHCAAFHRLVLPKLKSEYIETGTVRFVFRDFPLNWTAVQAAILTHCAEPDRYFALQDALFEAAGKWKAAETPLKALAKIGEEHGVERSKFKRCLEDGTLERQVLESYRFANNELGVDGTPTFFINEEKHVGGMSFETLSEKFEELLNTSE